MNVAFWGTLLVFCGETRRAGGGGGGGGGAQNIGVRKQKNSMIFSLPPPPPPPHPPTNINHDGNWEGREASKQQVLQLWLGSDVCAHAASAAAAAVAMTNQHNNNNKTQMMWCVWRGDRASLLRAKTVDSAGGCFAYRKKLLR